MSKFDCTDELWPVDLLLGNAGEMVNCIPNCCLRWTESNYTIESTVRCWR